MLSNLAANAKAGLRGTRASVPEFFGVRPRPLTLTAAGVFGQDITALSYRREIALRDILTLPTYRPSSFKGADMRALDAPGIDLGMFDLGGVKLNGAKLNGGDLSTSYLDDAVLTDGQFNGVNFYGTDLNGADMRRASFREADFLCADLRGARAAGADFSGAKLIATHLPDLRHAEIAGAEIQAGGGRRLTLRNFKERPSNQFNHPADNPDRLIVGPNGRVNAKVVSNPAQ